jgi:glucose/arabinose dehydrogenase
MRNTSIVVGAMALCAAAGGAGAQQLTAVRLPATFTRPVFVNSPPGDLNRIFVVEQRGSGGVSSQAYVRIFNLQSGSVNATPFLVVTGLGTNTEQGLLGMAFDPNYANNGLFYVSYTASPGQGISHITRYHVSANPDVADASSGVDVLTLTQPFNNHNGGWIGFGPDGYLYAGFGDGGNETDPNNIGQNPTTMLAKILRIDVSSLPYTIPPTNPWFGQSGVVQETWAWGLRNPWRPSFDRATGDFWIADVGQDTWEEINFQRRAQNPPFTAQNYGWRCYEGNVAYNQSAGCSSVYTFPFYVYQHLSNLCSITGGYVYRGCAMPSLRGTYFFADYCTARIWSLRYDGATISEFTERTSELAPVGGPAITGVMSFGEDGAGEIYICGSGGNVFKIVPRCPANCDGSTSTPVLNVNDFTCFLQKFGTGDCYANCDGSTTDPMLNVADFLCFLQKFQTSCTP